MSKWKDEEVNIVQIIPKLTEGYRASTTHIDGTIGLGSDSRLYKWDIGAGKWLKGWDTSNE